MTTQPRHLSHRERSRLAAAVIDMAGRYGQAERDHAYAGTRPYNPATASADLAEMARAFRKVHRRHTALARLVRALAEVTW